MIFSSPVTFGCADEGTEDHEEEWNKDADGEGTEDVNQHVGVTALPEHSTQHLRRVVSTQEHKIHVSSSQKYSLIANSLWSKH